MFNPDAKNPTHLKMLRFLGGFLANALMTGAPFTLNIAPAMWQKIMGQKLTLDDLYSVDFTTVKELKNLRT